MDSNRSITLLDLTALLDSKSYEDLLTQTQSEADEDQPRSSVLFFRGNALLGLGRAEEALSVLTRGVAQSPEDFWGAQLMAMALIDLSRHDEAVEYLRDYVGLKTDKQPQARELVKKYIRDLRPHLSDAALSARPAQAILTEALEGERFEDILKLTERAVAVGETDASLHFFRARAFLYSDDIDNAFEEVMTGYQMEPNSLWGVHTLVDIRLKRGEVDVALSDLKTYMDSGAAGAEEARLRYLLLCAEHGFLNKAAPVNEEREVIRIISTRRPYCVAIQCFNKPDTLRATLTALLACEGKENYDLAILQDYPNTESRYEENLALCAHVMRTIAEYLPDLMRSFSRVNLISNTSNMGTSPSCRKLLDTVCQDYEGFLFLEDDCILSVDALRWTTHHLDNVIAPEGVWFVGCESIFFDSQGADVSDELRKRLAPLIDSPALDSAHFELMAVTSTCFATLKPIWRMCSNIRSLPRGPECLNRYVTQLNRPTLLPVIPRAKDIGMLHDHGYSVNTMGRANVAEIKSTYLLSKGHYDPQRNYNFSEDAALLYAATSQIHPDSIEAVLAKYAPDLPEPEPVDEIASAPQAHDTETIETEAKPI